MLGCFFGEGEERDDDVLLGLEEFELLRRPASFPFEDTSLDVLCESFHGMSPTARERRDGAVESGAEEGGESGERSEGGEEGGEE